MELHEIEGFLISGATLVPSSVIVKFVAVVPTSCVTVTPGVRSFISLHATELPDPPPQPAKEMIGLVVGSSNEIVITPRFEQIASAAHPQFEVVSFRPGSVTRPVATNIPALPPRSAKDSVTSLMQRYCPVTPTW